MNNVIDLYGDELVTLFEGNKLKDSSYNLMAIIRSGIEKKNIEGVLTLNYDENFEDYLSYKIPPKTRKPAKLMSYRNTLDMIDRMTYGVLSSVIDDMPYSYPINYVLIDNHIYFHTGRKGYKLNGLNKKASFSVTEDLGMAYNGTHNFKTVSVYGTLLEVNDNNLKERILKEYINKLNKNHPPYVDSMLETTLVYEIDIDYMMGRVNLFLPD